MLIQKVIIIMRDIIIITGGTSGLGLELVKQSIKKDYISHIEIESEHDKTLIDFLSSKENTLFPTDKLILLSDKTEKYLLFKLLQKYPQEMLKTIRAAYYGESLIQAKVMKKILNEFCKLSEQKEKKVQPITNSKALDSLTEREKEVLSLIAKGMNNKEIASSLVISEATVKTHVANLMKKKKKRDRVELVLYALKSGFSILN